MSTAEDLSREDRIDRIVGKYADDVAQGRDPGRASLLSENADLREELERCFRMIEAGTAESPAAPSALASGATLGEYRILREIGRGGMSVVYLAEQPSLRRSVALKVLRGHLTLEPRHVTRFQREARAAARLRHPSIVAIHAVGEVEGHHFIAMDWLPGPTLAQVIAELAKAGSRPTAADLARATGDRSLADCGSYAEAVARLLLPVLEAVQAAHDAGLVHRDLKPSNILLDAQGHPSVADFGLAKGEGDLGLSLSGEPIGTPYYMSPEQARAASRGVDGRTDVYSLGVTIWELLALRRPFEGATYHELLTHILTSPPPSLRSVAKEVGRPLEAVVQKAIAKEVEDRYASPSDLAADLAAAVSGGPVRARIRWFANAGAARRMAAGGRGIVGWEYKSRARILGLPLVHVASGIDPGTGRVFVARGIFAMGNVAIGVFTFGGLSIGLFSFGGIALSVLASFGGLAGGSVAVGGVAGGAVAVGGAAAGHYVLAGQGAGTHVVSAHRRDEQALDFFEAWAPSLVGAMRTAENR